MSTTIGSYTKSPRHGFDVLGPIVGQPTFEKWVTYVAQLHRAIVGNEDLPDLDWARALFLTEIGFISVVVGFGPQFKVVDEHAFAVLRVLQFNTGNRDRRLLFREHATYPWFRDEETIL